MPSATLIIEATYPLAPPRNEAVRGLFFGWVGTHAISNELNSPSVRFAMSPAQTVAVAAVAVVAGMAASVLPGRRAARAVPVDALADT